jgi:DNA-binding NarL/FixJ family response regulator
MPMRVAIIEDQPEIRQSLALLIGGTPGLECVGSYRSMEEALAGFARVRPDVTLVDLGLPGMSGIEGIRIAKERYPDSLLLVLTIHDDDTKIFDALCAGACGYLLKDTAPARLLEGLREAVAGGSPMSPAVARRVISLFRKFRPPARVEYGLTPHEQRLLGMLVEGHSYASAATALGVSVNTIAFHLRHIYEKLQVHSKSQAVAKALRERMLD